MKRLILSSLLISQMGFASNTMIYPMTLTATQSGNSIQISHNPMRIRFWNGDSVEFCVQNDTSQAIVSSQMLGFVDATTAKPSNPFVNNVEPLLLNIRAGAKLCAAPVKVKSLLEVVQNFRYQSLTKFQGGETKNFPAQAVHCPEGQGGGPICIP